MQYIKLFIASIYLLLLQDTAPQEGAMARFQHQCHTTACISQSEVVVSNLRKLHYQDFQLPNQHNRTSVLMVYFLLFQKYFHVPMQEFRNVICCTLVEFEEPVITPPEESENKSEQFLLKHRIVIINTLSLIHI